MQRPAAETTNENVVWASGGLRQGGLVYVEELGADEVDGDGLRCRRRLGDDGGVRPWGPRRQMLGHGSRGRTELW